MTTIYLPTFAYFKKDIETVLGILEKNVDKNKFEIGLEIGGKPEHFLNKEGIERIVENMNSVAKGVQVTVHGFSGKAIYEIDEKDSHIADMSREEGKKECGKCHEMKPLNEYYKRRKGKSDIKSYCSICEGKARNPNYQPIDKGAVEAKRKARAELKEMNSKKRVKQEEERLQRKMLTEPRKEAIRMFNE